MSYNYCEHTAGSLSCLVLKYIDFQNKNSEKQKSEFFKQQPRLITVHHSVIIG